MGITVSAVGAVLLKDHIRNSNNYTGMCRPGLRDTKDRDIEKHITEQLTKPEMIQSNLNKPHNDLCAVCTLSIFLASFLKKRLNCQGLQ